MCAFLHIAHRKHGKSQIKLKAEETKFERFLFGCLAGTENKYENFLINKQRYTKCKRTLIHGLGWFGLVFGGD